MDCSIFTHMTVNQYNELFRQGLLTLVLSLEKVLPQRCQT
jgi:hypothetical protein